MSASSVLSRLIVVIFVSCTFKKCSLFHIQHILVCWVYFVYIANHNSVLVNVCKINLNCIRKKYRSLEKIPKTCEHACILMFVFQTKGKSKIYIKVLNKNKVKLYQLVHMFTKIWNFVDSLKSSVLSVYFLWCR